MSMSLILGAVSLAQLLLAIAMALFVFRLVRGPRAQDRVIALDGFYICGMLLLITLGIRNGSTRYFEASVIIALLGFASTVAFAKFLMRGEIVE